MKRLFLVFIIVVLTGGTYAQDISMVSTDEFRDIMNAYVSKGNVQYDRSCRYGIKMYADSIECSLQKRSNIGLLQQNDSLEYTADLYKLYGDWHYENGNYDIKSYPEAEKFLRMAEQIYEENSSLPRGLNNLPIIRRDVAQLLYKLGRYQEALSYMDSAYVAYERAYDNGEFFETDIEYLMMLDLQSQKAMCLARTGRTDEALEIMNDLLTVYPKTSENYYEILRKKAKIIILSGKLGSEKSALTLYKEYFTWRKAEAIKMLGTMTSSEREDYWMRIRPFIADCYQLESEDPTFLYDVTLFAKGLLLQLNRMSGYGVASESALLSLQYSWTDIQNVLSDDDCAIEFVQYEKLGNQLMGAIVLKKSGLPVWVGMMSPNTFYNYKIGTSGTTNRERLEATGVDTQGKRNRLYNDETFTSAIWHSELVSAIGNIKKIYFAPDGYLQQFAIEYMEYSPFAEAEIYRLSSTRRLLEKTSVCSDAALFVGNVDYNARDQKGSQGNDSLAFEHVVNSHVSFPLFDQADLETQSLMAIRNCPSDTLLSGSSASEQNFMQLCSKFPMLVISTHGHFDEAHIVESTEIKTNRTDESLSHSLLAMAGINMNTQNESFERDHKDGILSARELSNVDMGAVDMVVLAACQTGMGYITADGVFGLQRGFKNAGVDVLVVSLWEVHNDATRLLLLSFLNYMKEGLKAHAAFTKARQIMSDTDEANAERLRIFGADCQINGMLDSYEEPYYQNAFIMIDAIE